MTVSILMFTERADSSANVPGLENWRSIHTSNDNLPAVLEITQVKWGFEVVNLENFYPG